MHTFDTNFSANAVGVIVAERNTIPDDDTPQDERDAKSQVLDDLEAWLKANRDLGVVPMDERLVKGMELILSRRIENSAAARLPPKEREEQQVQLRPLVAWALSEWNSEIVLGGLKYAYQQFPDGALDFEQEVDAWAQTLDQKPTPLVSLGKQIAKLALAILIGMIFVPIFTQLKAPGSAPSPPFDSSPFYRPSN